MNERPKTSKERRADYLARLAAAGISPMRILVKADVARRIHAIARANVEDLGDTLAKAVAALEAANAATTALGAAAERKEVP